MKIDNHLLKGTSTQKVGFKSTSKTSGTFKKGLPDTVVIHFTAGRNAKSSIQTLTDSTVKASAHLVIGRDESITQLVPFNEIAWHAGKSSWDSRNGLNKYSIGIEIDNAGRLEKQGDEYLSWFGKSYPSTEVFEGKHRNENHMSYWHRYTVEQIEITEQVVKLLSKAYDIKHILGHEEISPGRKVDPGPAFPLDKLRNDILFSDRETADDNTFVNKSAPTTSAIVTATKLNIRDSPSKDATKVRKPLTQGTEVNILEEQGDWCRVSVVEEGWVSKKWLEIKPQT